MMTVIAVLSAACVAFADASGFLAYDKRATNKNDIEKQFLEELSAGLASSTIRDVREELQPLYVALPKNDKGRLEPSVVRYGLHRYFAHKFGWHLKGVDPKGARNGSSPASIMHAQVPSYIQSLFEEQLHGEGLGLDELAVFASTLMNFIHKEIADDTATIYGIAKLSIDDRVEEKVFDTILRMTLITRIDGIKENASMEDFLAREQFLIADFLMWPFINTWATDSHHSFELMQSSRRNPFKAGYEFQYTVGFMREMAYRYGHVQDIECSSHKRRLMDMEYEGTGRVPLSKFYNLHDEDWPFTEKVSYLRSMGSLDETDAQKPSVIIPNYLQGASNCLSPSSFYSVCCLDECEGLLSHIERMVAQPLAEAGRIAEVVSNLASDTVDAPRNLSTSQLTRLSAIAAKHEGKVPLHGRLFAQWLHHAFPRECVFPHVSGTTEPLSPLEWVETTGDTDMFATDEEMEDHQRRGVKLSFSFDDIEWNDAEELVGQQFVKKGSSASRAYVRSAMLLLAVAAAVVPLMRTSKLCATCPSESESLDKHYV